MYTRSLKKNYLHKLSSTLCSFLRINLGSKFPHSRPHQNPTFLPTQLVSPTPHLTPPLTPSSTPLKRSSASPRALPSCSNISMTATSNNVRSAYVHTKRTVRSTGGRLAKAPARGRSAGSVIVRLMGMWRERGSKENWCVMIVGVGGGCCGGVAERVGRGAGAEAEGAVGGVRRRARE